MSHVMLLLAHPRPDSYCHAIADRIRTVLTDAGADVRFHDLYAEQFDPIVSAEEAYTTGESVEAYLARESDTVVGRHRAELREARGLVVVHPNWWGKPPAILAGWMDRVVVPGVAYRLPDATGEPESLVTIERMLVVNTSDTTAEREEAVFGDPLEAIWGRCLAPYLGGPSFVRHVLRPVTDATPQQRRVWLDDVAETTRTLFER
ncbi:NAD(P)H-dependent oxidoreductase [Prescottella equi]|uniref:Flavodoxin family protein n=1 Tax=Rhodococcus hoagii TaxID=43767 RepID=A0A9Q2PKS5_RHOHA|nr:NAD(P)H-dependent oxidoreductase [Prescottella equi]MBM4488839.1 flavodoxin family protein [Prescottella equi]MBM4498796.1 flavodoxin family protein [Prescottella equi]MBM4503758.1 flavodoxin family protein [Prescottella equi]MBM4514058.1 flavodoxin family protein [Prescottella equi]MBM4553277.1 flavodoxin family protein [Prescottella equi]